MQIKKKSFRLRSVLTILVLLLLAVVFFILVRLLALRADISAYRAYWQAQNSQPAAKNAIIYVALGDSAAQSIGASKPQKGYVGLLADQMSAKYGRPVKIINLSKSGAKAVDVVNDQLPELAKLKPDIVTIDIGGNDVIRYDKAIYEKSINNIVEALPKVSIVADTPYFGGSSKSGSEARSLEMGKYIRLTASQRGLAVAELHNESKVNHGFSYYAADFFHPSDKGYISWVKAFSAQLPDRL